MKIGKYHFSFIKEVLMTLRANNMDEKRTAGMYDGVSVTTLRRWRAQFAEVLWESNPIIVKDPDVGIKVKREIETQPLRDTATKVTNELLHQILEKLEMGKPTLRELTNTFKEVVPYIMPKFEKGNKVGDTSVEVTYEAFMNNIYDKLKGNVKQEKLTIKSTKTE